jgi:hypothetical protein
MLCNVCSVWRVLQQSGKAVGGRILQMNPMNDAALFLAVSTHDFGSAGTF